MTFNDIVRMYGGKSRMAQYFDVTRRAIWEWGTKKVPIKYLPRFMDELNAHGISLDLEEINDIFRSKTKKK